ncbi:DUF6612 family protein [Evansella tamaricis]|uniref:Lipoprotein n=1 Tax=Evansella tamaricis TaxID=2069301 RepID=A0ABS6JF85_9BACI|nr:DUF6612 family protein [Evansella tamaricis]MBU9711125.1 hypothetical protein [Evansella tamaricis]
MKKWLLLIILVSFSFLGACSTELTEDAASIEEILNNSIAAMGDLTSYSMTLESEQTMGSNEDDSITLATKSEMDLLLEPLSFYQNITMNLEMMGIDMSYESYFTEDLGFYMEEPFSGQWSKLPDQFNEEYMSLTETQLSPEEQLLPFKDYISELAMTEDNDHYTIQLVGSGADMQTLMEHISGLAGEGMDDMFFDVMSDLDIHSIEYEFIIEKETYFQKEANIYLELTMDVMGEKITLEQRSSVIMYNFNSLNDFTIPEDIINNAVELDDEDFMTDFNFDF